MTVANGDAEHLGTKSHFEHLLSASTTVHDYQESIISLQLVISQQWTV